MAVCWFYLQVFQKSNLVSFRQNLTSYSAEIQYDDLPNENKSYLILISFDMFGEFSVILFSCSRYSHGSDGTACFKNSSVKSVNVQAKKDIPQ